LRCPRAARITLYRGVGRLAVHARCFVVRVAHARRGQLGQHRIEGGAGFRVEQAVEAAHPASVLLINGQIAPPGPIGLIGQIAVLVEHQRQPIGGGAELRGPQPGGDPGQVGLGLVPGLGVDAAGQLVEELLDGPHMLGPDLTARLRGGHIRQRRGQRFSGHGGARPQQLGLLDPPLGLVCGDPQRFGEHLWPRVGAQLGRCGLRGELMDQLVIDRRLGAVAVFEPLLDRQHLRCGQPRETQPGHIGLGLLPPRDNRQSLRVHTSNTSSI